MSGEQEIINQSQDYPRLTPERLAEEVGKWHRINASLAQEPALRTSIRANLRELAVSLVPRLLHELDAVTRERDDLRRCRSTWQGKRCRDQNGHSGIHVAEDESDWIDGDNDPAPIEEGEVFYLRDACCMPLHLSGSNSGGICILDFGHDGPCEGF